MAGSRPSTSYHTVGTAAAKVARSAAMNRASGSACANRFGNRRSAPTSQAAYGIPQALPWNMGTTGSRRSCWLRPRASPGAEAQRVQERRAVAVHDALRQARGPAGVAHRGRRVLVDLRPRISRAVRRPAVPRSRCAPGSADRSPSPYTIRWRSDSTSSPPSARTGPEDRRQAGVGDEHGVLGVADDVADLLRRQPDVDGVHHRAHAGDGEVRLLVLLGVPGEGRDPVAGLDAQAAQAGRQLIHTVGQRPELDAPHPVGLAGDDLAVGVGGPAVVEDVPTVSGKSIMVLRMVNLLRLAFAGRPSAVRAAPA